MLNERQKKVVEQIGSKIYNTEMIEQWMDRTDTVFSNAVAALSIMGVRGFMDAVDSIIADEDRCIEELGNEESLHVYDFVKKHKEEFSGITSYEDLEAWIRSNNGREGLQLDDGEDEGLEWVCFGTVYDKLVAEGILKPGIKAGYLANPYKCPFCRSEDIETSSFDGENYAQEVSCKTCGGTWDDLYILSDVVLWVPAMCKTCKKINTPECENDRKEFKCREVQ